MNKNQSNCIQGNCDRKEQIWDSMQCLFLDTKVDYAEIALICANSQYSIIELKEILYYEVFPALRFNLYDLPGGEWFPFDLNWLKGRILKKNTHGKFFQPIFGRFYTNYCWKRLKPLIIEVKQSLKGNISII